MIVTTACRQRSQPTNSHQTTKNRPRADAATCRNRHDTSEMRFATQRLSGGDMVSKHMHRICLLGAFRDIGVERTIFMLTD